MVTKSGHAAVLVDHEAHVLFGALHLAQQLVDLLDVRHKRRRALDFRDGPRGATLSGICSRSCEYAIPVMWSMVSR